MKRSVLVLEDNEFLARSLEKSLAQSYRVVSRTSLRTALEALRTDTFDALVCDFHLTDGYGTILLAEAQRVMPGARRILLTVAVPNLTSEEIESHLVEQILVKPCGVEDLRRAIEGRTT